MKILTVCMLSVLLAGVSCKKEHSPNNGDPQQYVLRSVEYQEANAKAEYTYDSEGLLQEIKFSDGTSNYTSSYDYLNKFIKKISVSDVLYEQTYSYLNGRITSIISTSLNHADKGDRLVFSYNTDGTVSELKYYVLDIAGEHLVYTSGYEYDGAGMLKRILSVNTGGTIEWNIESYSAGCVFNPFTFIQPKIEDAYEIYNFPVLSKLKQLPAKISKRIHTGERDPYIQKTYSTGFVIQNKRIEKAITNVTFPEAPDDNFTSTAIFKY